MRVILATLALAAALFTGAAFAPAPAPADDCMSDPTVPLVQIENAEACGGSTGLLAVIGHTEPDNGFHWDCVYFSDWPYPRMWTVHGC